MIYNNYHRHSIYSNIRSLDTVTKPVQYMERMKELNHSNYFTTEHGYQGNVYEAKTLCGKYGFKMIVGTEFYYVDDVKEKDRGNYHLICIALNNNGYRQINKALSYANTEGMYYKPRIDKSILFSFNPNDVIITSACSAGILSMNNHEELIIQLKQHFKDNFYLEVQSHKHISQVEHNIKVMELSRKYNINIIHANDSHYIKPEDAKYRTLFLKAKGINYPEEEGYILDYPSYDEIIERYKLQGVLTDEECIIALKNTLIFDKCEELTMINDDIKLPKISKNPNKELKEILNKEWLKEKKNIPKERHAEYIDAIRYEVDIIEKTSMEEYFIINHKMVNKAVEKYGGVLSFTGRGSCPSFFVNKLLKFTDIDRLDCPVTLYPTRFMSTERILTSKSLPDIDMNTSDPQPFIKASKELLGEDCCQWMLSYKPLQDASAFRLWCKANDMNISDYNEVAKNLDKYINHKDWKDIIEDSKVFVGVVESLSPSPCSTLLLDKPISEEVGLIKVGDVICCNLDGYNCDKYKYLKNDILTVSVWKIIKETCDLIGIKIPSIRELKKMLNIDTYKMYKEGLTTTLNQADSDFATPLFKKYSPNNIAEVSQMVCMIRPGAASMLEDFLDRRDYTTGLKELDELLADSKGRMCYQESVMSFLIWLGVKESSSYDILKKIAKKSFKENELEELHKQLIDGWINRVGDIEGFDKMWTIVEQNSKYSFNSSHSVSVGLDSLYGAYLKANYPLEYYTVVFNNYDGDIDRTIKLTKELEYFDIEIKDPKFRYSKSEYFPDKLTKSIYKGISSIKFVSEQVGECLYSLRDNQYNTFTELLIDLKGNVNSKQLEILIKLDFFGEFGKSDKLIKTKENFENIYDKKQFKKDRFDYETLTEIKKLAKTETEKMYKDLDTLELCKALESKLENKDIPIQEKVKCSFEFTGSCNITSDKVPGNMCIVTALDTKYSPKITLYSLKSGNSKIFKCETKLFKYKPIELFDTIQILEFEDKNRKKRVEDKICEKTGKMKYKYVPIEGEMESWLTNYTISQL